MNQDGFGFNLGKVSNLLQSRKPQGRETETAALQLPDYLPVNLFLARSCMDYKCKTNVPTNSLFRLHDAYLEIINASRFEFQA